MKINSIAMCVLVSSNFVLCMEKTIPKIKPGSFTDIVNAIKTLEETKQQSKGNLAHYATMMLNLNTALANLTKATDPKTLQDQSVLQKVQSAVETIKQQQDSLSKTLDAQQKVLEGIQKDGVFTNSLLLMLLKSPEQAAKIGSAVEEWMKRNDAENNGNQKAEQEQSFSNRRRTKPLRSDIVYTTLDQHDGSDTVG